MEAITHLWWWWWWWILPKNLWSTVIDQSPTVLSVIGIVCLCPMWICIVHTCVHEGPRVLTGIHVWAYVYACTCLYAGMCISLCEAVYMWLGVSGVGCGRACGGCTNVRECTDKQVCAHTHTHVWVSAMSEGQRDIILHNHTLYHTLTTCSE